LGQARHLANPFNFSFHTGRGFKAFCKVLASFSFSIGSIRPFPSFLWFRGFFFRHTVGQFRPVFLASFTLGKFNQVSRVAREHVGSGVWAQPLGCAGQNNFSFPTPKFHSTTGILGSQNQAWIWNPTIFS